MQFTSEYFNGFFDACEREGIKDEGQICILVKSAMIKEILSDPDVLEGFTAVLQKQGNVTYSTDELYDAFHKVAMQKDAEFNISELIKNPIILALLGALGGGAMGGGGGALAGGGIGLLLHWLMKKYNAGGFGGDSNEGKYPHLNELGIPDSRAQFVDETASRNIGAADGLTSLDENDPNFTKLPLIDQNRLLDDHGKRVELAKTLNPTKSLLPSTLQEGNAPTINPVPTDYNSSINNVQAPFLNKAPAVDQSIVDANKKKVTDIVSKDTTPVQIPIGLKTRIGPTTIAPTTIQEQPFKVDFNPVQSPLPVDIDSSKIKTVVEQK